MNKITAFFLINLLIAGVTVAQTTCTTEISYKWSRGEKEELTIHFSDVKETGADEAAVKATLQSNIIREKKRASEACKDLHENLAGCVSAKFAATSSQLQSLTFTARKALEEAISADCKAQQGKCLEIVSPEPKCQTKVKEDPAAAADGKKDDKKKKK